MLRETVWYFIFTNHVLPLWCSRKIILVLLRILLHVAHASVSEMFHISERIGQINKMFNFLSVPVSSPVS